MTDACQPNQPMEVLGRQSRSIIYSKAWKTSRNITGDTTKLHLPAEAPLSEFTPNQQEIHAGYERLASDDKVQRRNVVKVCRRNRARNKRQEELTRKESEPEEAATFRRPAHSQQTGVCQAGDLGISK